jgi:hypothetical protein
MNLVQNFEFALIRLYSENRKKIKQGHWPASARSPAAQCHRGQLALRRHSPSQNQRWCGPRGGRGGDWRPEQARRWPAGSGCRPAARWVGDSG